METSALDGIVAIHRKIFRGSGGHLDVTVTRRLNGTEVTRQDDFQAGIVGGVHVQIQAKVALLLFHLFDLLFFLDGIVDEHDKVVVFHLGGLVERDGEVGAVIRSCANTQLDVVERSRHANDTRGDSCTIESVVVLARRGHSQKVARIELQIQIKVFQLVMMYHAFDTRRVTQGIRQHHVFERDGFVVQQNRGAEGVIGFQVIDFAAAVLHR